MRTMNSTVLNKSSSFLKDLCDAQVFFLPGWQSTLCTADTESNAGWEYWEY